MNGLAVTGRHGNPTTPRSLDLAPVAAQGRDDSAQRLRRGSFGHRSRSSSARNEDKSCKALDCVTQGLDTHVDRFLARCLNQHRGPIYFGTRRNTGPPWDEEGTRGPTRQASITLREAGREHEGRRSGSTWPGSRVAAGSRRRGPGTKLSNGIRKLKRLVGTVASSGGSEILSVRSGRSSGVRLLGRSRGWHWQTGAQRPTTSWNGKYAGRRRRHNHRTQVMSTGATSLDNQTSGRSQRFKAVQARGHHAYQPEARDEAGRSYR